MSGQQKTSNATDGLNPAGVAGPFCLLDVPCGKKLRVQELLGDPAMRSRLYSLGILPGTEMEVCKNGGHECVCVRVRQSSLVLGDDMAEAVICCPLDETAEHGKRHKGLHCHGRHGVHQSGRKHPVS